MEDPFKLLDRAKSKAKKVIEDINKKNEQIVRDKIQSQADRIKALEYKAGKWKSSIINQPKSAEREFLIELRESLRGLLPKMVQKEGQAMFVSSIAGKLEVIDELLNEPERIVKLYRAMVKQYGKE